MKTTIDATQAGDGAQAEGSWLRTLNPNEKRTLTASFSGCLLYTSPSPRDS